MPVHDPGSGVCYFVSINVEDFVFIGGAMVTDDHGLPVEFRYTEPVRANRLQRVLYGDVLERFIHTDVILTNLLERIEHKTALIIVSDPLYLTPIASETSKAVWLGETRLPRLASLGAIQDVSIDEFLLQMTDSGSPFRIKFAPGQVATEGREKIAATLTKFSETMDILEPLCRVESAIRLIWEESPDNPILPMAA
jgi:hypothetical protein